jgi:membrane-bound lytic murein transglycosylase D
LQIWTYPNTKVKTTKTTTSYKIPADFNGKKTHTVQPGDTLWDISRMYKDLNIQKIKALNKLSTDKLKPGQVLIIG